MSENIQLAMGGGGGGTTIVPDTVTSQQTLLLLIAFSEGEVESLDNVTFNDSSIVNYGADIAWVRGTLTQDSIEGFDKVGAFIGGSSQEIRCATGSSPNSPTYTIPADARTARVIISFPSGVSWQSPKGNVSTSGAVLTMDTAPDAGALTWTEYRDMGKAGIKTSSPYSYDIMVPRPIGPIGSTGWAIRVRRISADAVTSGPGHYNKTYVQTVIAYSNTDFTTYAGTACFAVRINDASEVGNSIPTVGGEGRGMRMYLPKTTYYVSDYEDVAYRTYLSGSWDGTFGTTKRYTENLSWVIYNLLGDKLNEWCPIVHYSWVFNNTTERTAFVYPDDWAGRWVRQLDDEDNVWRITSVVPTIGTGSFETVSATSPRVRQKIIRCIGIPEEYLAKYTFEKFARYCDEEITATYNGSSYSEFRHSVNGQFIERKEAEVFINDLLSIGNADIVEIDGLVSIIYDRKLSPEELAVVPLFTNQNVDNGIFEYSGSDIVENYTQINVTIQDKDNMNRTKTISVQSSELATYLSKPSTTHYTDLYEFNSTDIILQGCNSDFTAVRKGRSLLFDGLENDRFVHFKLSLLGASLHKGQVIQVQDSDNAKEVLSGRVVSSSWETGVLTLTLDREITFSGVTELILYVQAAATTETKLTDTDTYSFLNSVSLTLNETSGTHSVVTADTTEITLIPETTFAIVEEHIEYFTITAISLDEGVYTVSGLKYQTVKFDYIEHDRTDARAPVNRLALRSKNNKVIIDPDTDIDFAISLSGVSDHTEVNEARGIYSFNLTWTHIPVMDDVSLRLVRKTTYKVACKFPNGSTSIFHTDGNHTELYKTTDVVFKVGETTDTEYDYVYGELTIPIPNQVFDELEGDENLVFTFTITASCNGADDSPAVTVTKSIYAGDINYNVISGSLYDA